MTNLIQEGKFVEAEPLARVCLAMREQITNLPATDRWVIPSTRSALGTLAGQGRYAEAEPVLLAAYDGLMKTRQTGTIRETTRQLGLLYDATAQPEKSAEWKNKAQPAAPPQKP